MRSGLSYQLGWALESTWGVPVTPTVFQWALPGETLEQKIDIIESAAVIAGRRTQDPTQWAQGRISAGGDTPMELYTRSAGKLFKSMFGGVNTTGSDPYTHTYTPGDLTGVSVTLQKGVPGVNGTVVPFTYPGSKVASWSIGCKEGEIATLGLTWESVCEVGFRTVGDSVTNSTATVTSATAAFGPDDVGKPVSGTNIPAASYVGVVNSATSIGLSSTPYSNTPVNATGAGSGGTLNLGIALASASYATLRPFHYDQASLTIGGTAVPVKEATLNGDNMFVDQRRFLGSRFQSESLEGKDIRKYDGKLTAEFTDRTLYNRFVNGVEAALVLAFVAGTDTLTITTNVRFSGGTPEVKDKGVVEQELDFTADGTTDAAAVTAVLVDHDATV